MATLSDLVVNVKANTTNFNKGMAEVGGVTDQAKNKFSGLSSTVKMFGGVLAGVGLAEASRGFIRITDSLTNMESRLRLVTGSQAELNSTMSDLVDLSLATRTGLESNVVLYTRIAQAAQTMGKSQEEILRVVELVGKAAQISGASATEANAAMLQLSQGLAAGTLRGEELNSVLEQMPALARSIAAGMGIAFGDLRRLAAEGQVTAEQVIQAIIKEGEALDATFAKIEPTVSGSLVNLNTEFQLFIKSINEATGASDLLVSGINALSKELREQRQYAQDLKDANLSWAESLQEVVYSMVPIFRMTGAYDELKQKIHETAEAQRALNNRSVTPRSLLGGMGLGGVLPKQQSSPQQSFPMSQAPSADKPKREIRKVTDEVAKQTVEYKKLSAAIVETAPVNTQAIKQMGVALDSHVGAYRKNQQAIETNKDAVRQLGFTFSSAFEDAIVSGGKLGDVLKGLYTDIARIIARKTIVEPLANAAAGIFGQIDFGKFLPSFAGGAPTVPRDMVAKLHAGEKVVTKGESMRQNGQSAQGATFYQSFNFATGLEGVAQGEILKAMPAVVQAAKNATLSALQQGGRASQIVGLRS